ncbi:tripartite tricarboxylate transporter substrate binding protein [Rhodoplanes sp. TEM]|uniref:Tripartite tricarboxylate transporter substrate binding protein n=1 Tax=Rhodoplanes tepidamans TaxID=200616 RepID=A0ABT5JGR5_RHOTP|nr:MULTISPECIES: tripartite tricarboxylate transporter substrate binding protein [Rhodoplanes]MDC7788774.1 tripartite tricarboxylate transporter substrate binding protein [Rhodoplanes tepidamans]MDC7984106.1 tripartite tricarboxylate transporter substrate binding protein [Rhodoplanes sp. TEM]
MKLLATVALCLGSLASPAWAQDAYPSRTVRLVVPFPAGGPTDVFARQYAARMSAVLGQQMIVENKAGAAGAIGSTEVARAPADGYTLLFATASTHGLYNLLSKSPKYDSLDDFSPVAIVGSAPAVVVVHPSGPADLAALVAAVKANPGKLQYGSPGTGTFLHLAGEMFKTEAGGLDIPHIPYKGSAPAMNDLIGNQVGMVIDTLGTSLPQHRGGKARILAVASAKRSELAPDIPTVDEALKIKGFEAGLWNLVAAPAGTPQPVLTRLQAATARVMADPDVQAQLRKLGIDPVTESSPAAARAFIERERARFKPVVAAAGVSID